MIRGAHRRLSHFGFVVFIGWVAMMGTALAGTMTRTEALKIADGFIQHQWKASTANVRHGKDADGVEIHTPDRTSGHGVPLNDCWTPDSQNTGAGGNPVAVTKAIRDKLPKIRQELPPRSSSPRFTTGR